MAALGVETVSELKSLQSPATRLISVYLCTGITLGFTLTSMQFMHWFILPIWLCGVLITIDAVDWVRGRLRLFDPFAVAGLLGFHFFFLAPLLHVYWDEWLPAYITPPPDWRPWLGGMAILNALGLICYRITRQFGERPDHLVRPSRPSWGIDHRRFFILTVVGLMVTGAIQVWIYAQYGGLSGYLQAVESRAADDAFEGLGWAFMFADSFPILALMAFAVWASTRKRRCSWSTVAFVLLAFFLLRLFFGGLAGSRGNTIWALFWAVGIIHYWIRPLSQKIVLTGCVFVLLFMYIYGFFKASGVEGLRALQSAEAHTALSAETGRTMHYLLLNDLGRSGIQAFVLYRQLGPGRDYRYAWGRTYLGTLALFIPRSIWSDRPASKTLEGTEIIYGAGASHWMKKTSAVFGLAGEGMLNFGPLAVPFLFMIFGLFAGGVRRFMLSLTAGDSRLLFLPLLICLCLLILVADSDNVMFFLVKNGTLPFLTLFLASRRPGSRNSDPARHLT